MFMIMNLTQAAILITLPSVFLANPSWAYTVRWTDAGNAVHWHQSSVTICLDESLSEIGDPKEVGDVIAEAFATWEGSGVLPTTFDVVECGPSGANIDDPSDGRNVVGAISGRWPYATHANAVTLVSYDSTTGIIVDVDILFHADIRWSLTNVPPEDSYDLLDTATHEVGHLIGLEHSERQRATMYEVASPGSVVRRTLHDDDISGVRAIYGVVPLGRVTTDGCSMTPHDGAPESAGVIFGTFILFVLTRRWMGLKS